MPNPFEGRRPQATEAFRPIIRTNQPYIEDVCDAYNAAKTREDVEWHVSLTGELKIGFTKAASERNERINRQRNETERARHLRNHLNGYQKDEPDAQG